VERALVLTGGGARAAYQVGVLKGIAEAFGPFLPKTPFRILCGVSAGAINASFLASHAEDFVAAAEALWTLWSRLRMETVFVTDPIALSRVGIRLVAELGLGSLLESRSNHLLDTAPLRKLLENEVKSARIRNYVRRGTLSGVAVTATNYATGAAVTFFEDATGNGGWSRSSRVAVRSAIEPRHVLASSALPIFFPPVAIDGQFYGDGCIRMTAPLSPAIHLGADRVLAIGIRYLRPVEETERLQDQAKQLHDPTLAEIAGVLLNAVFLDALETDLERMNRINRTVSLLGEPERIQNGLRRVPVLAVRPSRDLGRMASAQFSSFPRTLRHLLQGMGASRETGWDLMSYLAFEQTYTEALLALGRADAFAQKQELEAFFFD
jgi:NTE family protein